MTITVEISAEVQAEMERQAARKGCAVDSFVAGLIQKAVHVSSPKAELKKNLVDFVRGIAVERSRFGL